MPGLNLSPDSFGESLHPKNQDVSALVPTLLFVIWWFDRARNSETSLNTLV